MSHSNESDEPASDERLIECPRCWGHGDYGGVRCDICHGRGLIPEDCELITMEDLDTDE